MITQLYATVDIALPTRSQPHPCSSQVRFNAPSTTLTQRQRPSLTEYITDLVGWWHGQWAGGSVELLVIPAVNAFIKYQITSKSLRNA